MSFDLGAPDLLFVRPWALAGLLAIVGLALLSARGFRAGVVRLGPWPRLQGQARSTRSSRARRAALQFLGLSLLVIAVAGPRIGPGASTELRPLRDVVVVLDVSRSMRAEQPSRLEKALRTLRSLQTALRADASVRIALVTFAARPHLAFPLTRDYDHVRIALDRIGDEAVAPTGVPPSEAFVSGTRLGIAVKEALACLPTRRPGTQEVLLLSDGDDPVADEEWLLGVTAARQRGIPVHVVAVGDSRSSATIPYRGDVLRFDGEIVRTTVQLPRLEEIARATGGQFHATDQGMPSVVQDLREYWRSHPLPEEPEAAGASVTASSVSLTPWLLAALGVWIASLLPILTRPRMPRALGGAALLALVSAEPATDAWMRQGDAAYLRQDFEEALRCYRHAAVDANDPGLVSFNRAAAHFRRGEYLEAQRGYRQALEDDAAPPQRRARAWFDLGNTLLASAGDRDRPAIERALDAYRRCLALQPEDALRRDAEHNLEVAGRRWLRSQPPASTSPDTEPGTQSPKKNDRSGTQAGDRNKGDALGPAEGSEKSRDGKEPPSGGTGLAAPGALTVLPDQAERRTLSVQEALAHLERNLDRIRHDRRRDRGQGESPLRGKDW